MFAEEMLERCARLSGWARRTLARDPNLLDPATLAAPYSSVRMQEEIAAAAPGDEATLARVLRGLRQRVMLHVMARDLAGASDLEEVTATFTSLAQCCIVEGVQRLESWMAPRWGIPRSACGERQQLMVVGMGKLGGGELNVSSDVDLVFVYPEEGETDGPLVLSCHEYFERLGRRLIALLHESTGDGFVFRVDMRLRPYGDSGPLAASLDMLESYFATQGRAWERYAWLKARPLTGDAHEALMKVVTPFVFRRYLDFGTIQSLRELHAQIRAEVSRRDLADNIKLGRGGIREVEFSAQVVQLVRGGKEANLRVRPTLAALSALTGRGWLDPKSHEALRAAYRFLRRLEHCLQYQEDQQTHSLPLTNADQLLLAEAMGFAQWPALLDTLSAHRRSVERHFDSLFAGDSTTRDDDPLEGLCSAQAGAERVESALAALGFEQPRALVDRVNQFRASARFRRMAASGQGRVDRLLPRMVRAAATYPPRDNTFDRLLALVESIGRRESYLALLLEYPAAMSSVARLVSLSAWACEYLTRHPVLLDELIDPRELAEPDWPALEAALRHELSVAADATERQMDLLREFQHAQTFRLLMLDLSGRLTLERLSDHLSDLADVVLRQVLRCTWSQLRGRHRDLPRFAIIGYGKLGGKELGYASDLDIIFLHDDPAADAPEIYARLAQRINAWLTSHTATGTLYVTDLRLRPDGASGLLVSALEAFASYERTQAWVWEHQALTRARFVAGDAELGMAFEKLRSDILRLPRDSQELREQVLAMRDRMRQANPNDSELFDLKHDPGGIIDVEFVVQYLVLAHAHTHEALTRNTGNIALLELAASLRLVDAATAVRAAAGYRDLRRAQHALRLRGKAQARVPPEELDKQREAALALWNAVMGNRR